MFTHLDFWFQNSFVHVLSDCGKCSCYSCLLFFLLLSPDDCSPWCISMITPSLESRLFKWCMYRGNLQKHHWMLKWNLSFPQMWCSSNFIDKITFYVLHLLLDLPVNILFMFLTVCGDILNKLDSIHLLWSESVHFSQYQYKGKKSIKIRTAVQQ